MTTLFIAHLPAPSRNRVRRRGLAQRVDGVSVTWPAPVEMNGDDPFAEYLFLEAIAADLLDRVLKTIPEATLLTVHTTNGTRPATVDLERDVLPVIDRVISRSVARIDDLVGRRIAVLGAGEIALTGICVATRPDHLVLELEFLHATVTAVAPRDRCHLAD